MLDSTSKFPPEMRRAVIILAVLLSVQITASYGLSVSEQQLSSPQLGLLPAHLGSWTLAGEEALEPEVMSQLRPDDYILRSYRQKPDSGDVSLFVAYFKSLQNNYGPHSPRACLPGSGWLTVSWAITNLPLPGEPEGELPVNKYVLEKNSARILVIYWYQNNRHVWAEDFGMKLRLLPDLIRYRRSDVSLVRVITPLGPDGLVDPSYERAGQFVRDVFPALTERFRSGN